MMPGASSLWRAARHHFRCPRCGPGYPIDPVCLAAYLDPIGPDACPRCAQRREQGMCPSLGCRRGWLRVAMTHVVLGYKRGGAQRVLLDAKDAARPAAVTLLGRLLAGFLLADAALRAYDLILPVPYHPAGLRGRPAHPLTAIYLDAAPAVRPCLPLDDLAPPFLVQTRDVPPVRRQAEPARWRTVRGAFALGFRTRMLRGARIAVIDDVMTTGATLSECARVLCEDGGASSVDAIVLVRQPWTASTERGHDSMRDAAHTPSVI